jgi:predicted  nucleic acid-binding Zn-ribbon protein
VPEILVYAVAGVNCSDYLELVLKMDKENKKTKEKERLLKAIRAGVEEIDRKLKENYIAAEKTTEKTIDHEKHLHEFHKQVVSISDLISVSVSPLWKQVFSIIQL